MSMEDVERLKKISAMSKELQKHGIAVDSEEAYKQSEEIYQSERPQQFAEEPEAPAQKESDQFENKIHARLNQVEGRVDRVITKMNEMIKVVNQLESRLEQSGVPELPKERQETITKEAPKETESQSRSGNYETNDVAIDKIFYYGQK